jgi:membrane associated rhomboid family serine protease
MSFTEVSDDDERVADEVPDGEPVPVPVYTYALLTCIAAVFVAQFLTSADPEFFAADRFSAFSAGFDKQAFLNRHEYWRILTGATVHSGILHVALNSYALYSFGGLVEFLSNRAHLTIAFLLSAIGGGLLSLLVNPEGTSVGASGGIVGLLGYLAVYAFIRRQFISREFRKSLLINIGFILIFGLVLFNTIDNFGHIGGLITGAVYGFIQIPRSAYVDPQTANPITRYVGFAALAVYGLTSVLTILLLVNGSQK